MASEHPNGIGLKPQPGGNDSSCGLRPEPGVLCATKHRVTENNRGNFGGLQPFIDYPWSKPVTQKIYNKRDPEATLALCSLLNNVEFIIVLKDLTFSYPRFLSTSEEAVCYHTKSLWEWGKGAADF